MTELFNLKGCCPGRVLFKCTLTRDCQPFELWVAPATALQSDAVSFVGSVEALTSLTTGN